jgi:hypothetical protein
MLSDSLHVNYANPWVRPPVEVYGLNPFNDLDGIDVLYQARFGGFDAEIHPYLGGGRISFPMGKARLREAAGLNVVLSRGDLSVHIGHADGRFSLERRELMVRSLAAGLSAIGLDDAVRDLSGRHGKTSFDSIGVQWDDGRWQVVGEVARRQTNRYVSSSTGWYLSLGRRIGTFTPYLVVARQILDEPLSDAEIPASMPSLDAAWRFFHTSRNNAQRSVTLGTRWDVSPSAALKAELSHAQLDRDSWGSYFVRDESRAGRIAGSSANTFSLSLDLTF